MRKHSADVTPRVVEGSPASAIVAHVVEHSVAMVIMTSHGRTGVRRVIAGSVAVEVVNAANCSVVTVPTASR
jgi:nucleotide-binding universal stress UspA family protein